MKTHLEGVTTPTPNVSVAPTRTASHLPQLNSNTLSKLRSFQMAGEPDMIGEIAEILLTTTPAKLCNIAQFLQANQLSAAQNEAHSLKSSALTLGAEVFGEICHQIEAALTPTDAAKALVTLEDNWTSLTQELLLLRQTP